VSIPLAAAEDIIDASGIAPAIEDLLPRPVRERQLTARTLLIGMHLALADGRPRWPRSGRSSARCAPSATGGSR
jgi:hypothetical protein